MMKPALRLRIYQPILSQITKDLHLKKIEGVTNHTRYCERPSQGPLPVITEQRPAAKLITHR